MLVSGTLRRSTTTPRVKTKGGRERRESTDLTIRQTRRNAQNASERNRRGITAMRIAILMAPSPRKNQGGNAIVRQTAEASLRMTTQGKERRRASGIPLLKSLSTPTANEKDAVRRRNGRRGQGTPQAASPRARIQRTVTAVAVLPKKSKRSPSPFDLTTFDSFDTGSGLVYRALKESIPPFGLAQAPCALCPSFEFCKPGGPVNPQECVYYDDWLTSKTMATETAMDV